MELTGYLEKRGKWNTAWKKRYFYFNRPHRQLLYSKGPNEEVSGCMVLQSDTKILDGMDGFSWTTKKDQKRTFSVVTKKRVYCLRAMTDVQAEAWKTAIRDIVDGTTEENLPEYSSNSFSDDLPQLSHENLSGLGAAILKHRQGSAVTVTWTVLPCMYRLLL